MDAPLQASQRKPKRPIAWSKESILFSACQEDTRSELAALGPLDGKRVLCVTAGGGRVLNLLFDGPAAITAVDLNPAQNALLELKFAALRQLDHDAYLRLLGVRPWASRLAMYEALRRDLSPSAQRFFDSNGDAVKKGILFQGKLERYLQIVARVIKLGHPFGLKNLLDSKDLEEQRLAMARWDTPMWRSVAHLVCRRSVVAALSGDPGFYRNLPPDLPLHEVLYDRVHRHLTHNSLRENPFLQLVLYGRYVWETALPYYLNRTTFARVKAAALRVQLDVVTSTVSDALDADTRGFDAFSISDISSYLDPDPHFGLFERVLGRSNKGARLCSRANIYHRPLAAEHARRLRRDPDLERRLSLHDHATVHEFVVAGIH